LLIIFRVRLFLFLSVAAAFSAIAEPIDELRRFASDERDRLGIPGVSIGLIAGGTVEYVTLGVRRTDAGGRVSSNDAFDIGSISKPITAWGILKLAEQGRVSLDAPVNTYLGRRWQLPESDFDNDAVTLRKILSHTAGLSAPSYQGFAPGSAPLTLEDSLNGTPLASSAVRVVVEPGSEYRYSGGGFALAQLVVENVTGQTFSEFMRSEIFEPLGLRDATYLTLEQEPLPVVPHDYSGLPLADYRMIEQGAGGLRASAEDLVNFLMANMEPNPVLAAATVAELQGASTGLALGFERRDDLLRHGGRNRGWVASIDFQPSSTSGLAILTNSANGSAFVNSVRCKWSELFGIRSLTAQCERDQRAARNTRVGLVAVFLAVSILAVLLARKVFRSYRSGESEVFIGVRATALGLACLCGIATIWLALGTDWIVYFSSGVHWGFPAMNYLPTEAFYVATAFTAVLAVLLGAGFLRKKSA
jgi:CubicO group peptidase (beta-lactamase class C family)